MARSLVFGNGRLHVGLDESGSVADLYFPRVGLENHIGAHGLAHKVGVYVDGSLHWLSEDGWEFRYAYHAKTMVGDIVATHEKLGIRCELTDVLDSELDLFVRSLHVINLKPTTRRVTVFMHQAFVIADAETSDTVLYRPDLPAVMHYKGNRVFLASLQRADGSWFDDYSVGKFDVGSGTGTYCDADDGQLAKNMVDNGRTDSVMACSLEIEAAGSMRCYYSLVAAESMAVAEDMFQELVNQGPLHFLSRSASAWHSWVSRAAVAPGLPFEYQKALETSLVIVKSHIDSGGAVMASLDSSLRDHPQDDTYAFCWGRDAAYSLWPLIRLGYREEAVNFFRFVRDALHEDGYLLHKYRADGSLGSTWLPYVHPDGAVHPPIQADETATVLFMFGQYYRHTNDHATLATFYDSLIAPMANFLAGYTRDDGLPRPSYDLWEHQYFTHTYTTAVTYASLLEAAELADAYGRSADRKRWQDTAEAIKREAGQLYNEDEGYFYRGILTRSDGTTVYDATVDIASLYGVFMFGLFDLDSPQLVAALVTARQRLVRDSACIRFVGDTYYAAEESANAWPIATLWMSEIALELDEFAVAEKHLAQVMSLLHTLPTLPEQVLPTTDLSPSVRPLVWSHAELMSAIIDHMQGQAVHS